jgi:hypothetical protein
MRGRFLRIVLRQLAQQPRRNRFRIGALLLLWEVSNFSGYLYGAIHRWLIPAEGVNRSEKGKNV